MVTSLAAGKDTVDSDVPGTTMILHSVSTVSYGTSVKCVEYGQYGQYQVWSMEYGV